MSIATYLQHIQVLETAARGDGYDTRRVVTSFRKLYYDSGAGARDYAGVTFGGGTWNILIPGATATRKPPSWASLATSTQYLIDHKVVSVGGKDVDMGHVFCGLDATNHPSSISLVGVVNMRSNKEAVTFVGDLGSVVVEYLHGASGSFHSVARERNDAAMAPIFDDYFSQADVAGDVDPYAFTVSASRTVHDAFNAYYQQGGFRGRHNRFLAAVRLGTASEFTALRGEVFNGALAYAAANGHRSDLVNVQSNPGPGLHLEIFQFDLGTPTFWEAYYNISGWALEMFHARLKASAY